MCNYADISVNKNIKVMVQTHNILSWSCDHVYQVILKSNKSNASHDHPRCMALSVKGNLKGSAGDDS